MRDMTIGSEAKHILFFSLPLLLGNLFQQLYNVVDTLVVGNAPNGDVMLAAVGTSFPIMFLMISLMMGISMGTSIIISQYFGAGDMENVKKVIGTSYVFLFFGSIFITILGYFISEPLLRFLGTPNLVMHDAKTYLQIMFIGCIATFGYNSVSAILRGVGDSKTPLIYIIVATVINIVLDIIFVLYLGYGVAGAAWATIISQACSFVFSVIHVNRTNKVLSLNVKNLIFDYQILKQILRIGIPSSMQQAAVSVGMLLIQSRVNYFGKDVMAAFSAASKIDNLSLMPLMNFGMALSTFVGQNIGAGKVERVNKGYRATMIMGVVFSLCVSLLVIAFGKHLMAAFNQNPTVIKYGQEYLTITASFYVVGTLIFITSGVIRGAGDSMSAMIFTIISLWIVRVPVAYALSSTNLAQNGIWYAQAIGWLVGGVASYVYYKSGKWKNKGIISNVYNEG